MHSNNLYI